MHPALSLTVALQVLQADLWRSWGHSPGYALGHSVGEISAAYVSGILDLRAALRIAYENCLVAAALTGKMVHTYINADALSLLPNGEAYLAAVNHEVPPDQAGAERKLSVTLCGAAEPIDKWLASDARSIAHSVCIGTGI